MSLFEHRCIATQRSLADRWNYSAPYDKSMKLGTLILGITGNVLKIRGNLDRICGRREGGGIFQYGRYSDYKDYYWKMKQKKLDTVLNLALKEHKAHK